MISLSKERFDELYLKYSISSFIEKDPVQFAYNYNSNEDRELAAFIASLLAFGRREQAIGFISKVLSTLGTSVYQSIYNYDPEKPLPSLVYRFIKETHISMLFYRLHLILRKYSSLHSLFMEGYTKYASIKRAIEHFAFCFNGKKSASKNLLLPLPSKGSACKRFNLFLRWMVRKDRVDTGIWDGIHRSELLIPIDTHVARISRSLSITKRKSVNWRMLEEIMEVLRGFDPLDPVRYDFALFGFGIENRDI